MGPFLVGDLYSPGVLGNMHVLEVAIVKRSLSTNQVSALTNRNVTLLVEDSAGLKGLI